MVRKFDDWWKTVPADLKQKARKGDESNKPLLNQINYVLQLIMRWLGVMLACQMKMQNALPRSGFPGAPDTPGWPDRVA